MRESLSPMHEGWKKMSHLGIRSGSKGLSADPSDNVEGHQSEDRQRTGRKQS